MVMREELRSVSREGGAQCVIHHGIMWMLKWCADNLVLVQQVKKHALESLQYSHAVVGATALSGSYYGRGSGPIYLDRVRCSGQESTITDCSQNFVGDVSSRCLAHTVDAGVQCNIGR